MLAVTSLLGDSITFDEMSHLTSGLSYLKTGDFRLAPDHPPLAKLWAALPLAALGAHWPGASPSWQAGATWEIGWLWFYGVNDGERLLVFARCMMVVLLLATCWAVYATACRLLGRSAGLLALTLAALSPTLLAHGRLVTTDLPLALTSTLVLLTFARLMERVTVGRLVASAAALAAASVTKFSWPVVLPALAVMVAVAWLRSTPLVCVVPGMRSAPDRGGAGVVLVTGRGARLGVLLVVAVLLAAGVWAGIWTCYGWRYSPFRGPDADGAMMISLENAGAATPRNMDEAWEAILLDWDGQPQRGLVAESVRWGRDHHALPEAYLYGLAYTIKSTRQRWGYLMGEVSLNGWWYYFPIAFAIKTPIPTLLLLVVGVGALAGCCRNPRSWAPLADGPTQRGGMGKSRRAGTMSSSGVAGGSPCDMPAPSAWACHPSGPAGGAMKLLRDPLLLAGLAALAVTYVALALDSPTNIGHRHLLPLYPMLFVLAGAAVAWWARLWGRILIGVCVVWLAAASLWIHPHYLSYFNELIGGPTRGHLYLADSNVDWGQDLKRLARYAARQDTGPIKLAYFGSANPCYYGFVCEMLPSTLAFGPPAVLTAGTYVVSVTQLLGVYDPMIRDEYWTPQRVEEYRRLQQAAASEASGSAMTEDQLRGVAPLSEHETLRRARLLNRLQHRRPDDRVGYSLFVYRLSQADVETLTAP
ncbi:MAG TPA: glycosyltransferase family 39 protein [Phycisphaerae bacterium]|nr:glycosyltransferase family 39 protein [Phycisphaerae bacterium]HNU45670.1 glycosyltransferase family 39 protein [Phycisphaerae bacterium]